MWARPRFWSRSCGNLGRKVDGGGGSPSIWEGECMPTCLFPGALCVSLMCVSLCACVREREGWHWQYRAGHVRAEWWPRCRTQPRSPSCPAHRVVGAGCRLPRDERHFSPHLGHRCGGTAEEMEPVPLPSSPTVKRLRAVIHFFKKSVLQIKFSEVRLFFPHPLPGHLGIQAAPPPPHPWMGLRSVHGLQAPAGQQHRLKTSLRPEALCRS